MNFPFFYVGFPAAASKYLTNVTFKPANRFPYSRWLILNLFSFNSQMQKLIIMAALLLR
jgi:hypothetical protein